MLTKSKHSSKVVDRPSSMHVLIMLLVCVCAYTLGMPPIAQNKLETEAANIRNTSLNFKDFYKLISVVMYLHVHVYYGTYCI